MKIWCRPTVLLVSEAGIKTENDWRGGIKYSSASQHGGVAAGATGAMAPPKFWFGATMHLAPPISGLYIR